MAQSAGLSYSIRIHKNGLLLTFEGFSDRQPHFLAIVLAALRTLVVRVESEEGRKKLMVILQVIEQSLIGWSLESPYHMASFYVNNIRNEHSWTPDEKLLELKCGGVAVKDVVEFHREFFRFLKVEMLVHGWVVDSVHPILICKLLYLFVHRSSLDLEEAKGVADSSERILSGENGVLEDAVVSRPLDPNMEVQSRILLLPSRNFLFARSCTAKEELNSVVEFYLQTGSPFLSHPIRVDLSL